MKRLIRAVLPRPLIHLYHRALAMLALLRYRFPSRQLIVIGVTGTTGKSTVVNWIAYLLRNQGYTVGVSSTPLVAVGDEVHTNRAKMTMPGRFAMQRLLRKMADAGCRYAVIEMTSEGLAQHRALGIAVDVAVFTNLTPEHIESHGSFAAYRSSKGKLFQKLSGAHKTIGGTRIPKIAIVNADDLNANFFLGFPADKTLVYRTDDTPATDIPPGATVLTAENIRSDKGGMRFRLNNLSMQLPWPGRYQVSNALAAVAVAVSQGISLPAMRTLLTQLPTVPGRMDFVEAGQPFTVVVDYAHEPVSLEACYVALHSRKPKRLIAVLGGTGGGRDTGKRPVLGQLAATYADIVVVTNEDPYDDDPQLIIDQVAAGAEQAGKQRGKNLFTILDRREAIREAIRLARPGDAVVLTGKGNEPWIVSAGGHKIPWDERQVAREEIENRLVDKSDGSARLTVPKSSTP